jgi:transcriptional regulator with XRE-family HTH domain
LLGLSQTELADAAGITFHQIQKCEKGVNRVGASRLQQFSEALGFPPSYFFEGVPTVEKKTPAPQEGELSEDTIVSFLGTREGAALVRAFIAIKQKPVRQNVIVFLDTLKGKYIEGHSATAKFSQPRRLRAVLFVPLRSVWLRLSLGCWAV